ncbi:MAG: hypothetical protein LBI45_09115 [Bacteroidales bacterium]|jgi:hypothetical protein|nr:hypothetical protein [Bacteroidales bacterium]
MKKSLILTILSVFFTFAIVFVACKKDEETTNGPIQKAQNVNFDISNFDVSITGIDYCGTPEIKPLIAGQNYLAGYLVIGNDEDNVYVTYVMEDQWKLKKTHLYLGVLEGTPPNVAPGQFPYQAQHADLDMFTYSIPKGDVNSNSACFIVGAHADVNKNGNGAGSGKQTAWGKGEKWASNGDWAMYNSYCLQECIDNYTITLGPIYGSVTATNQNVWFVDSKGKTNPDVVVPNSNHFVYATLSRTALEDGVTLDMVVGNKFEKVGTAFVKLVGGNIVITINNEFKVSFGAVAFTKKPDNKMPKNGNIHSQKFADLQPYGALTGFNHNTQYTIPCPAAANTIYLYIHCEAIQFIL